MRKLGEVLEQRGADLASKDAFLSHIANSWYLNAISRLSDEQIVGLIHLFETGVLFPSTDILGKALVQKIELEEKILHRSPSQTSVPSSDEQGTLILQDRVPSYESLTAPDIKVEHHTLVEAFEDLHEYHTLNGSEAVSHVAYNYSDISFIYPVYSEDFVGKPMLSWSAEKKTNARGFPTKVINMVTQHGSAESVRGALTTGAKASVVMSSAALGYTVPSMYDMVRDKTNPVFHVAVQSITDDLVIEYDHSHVYQTAHTGFSILASSTVQEAQDLAVVAHLLADVSKTPVLHFFDGSIVASQESPLELVQKEQLIHLKSLVHKIHADSPADALEKIAEKTQAVLNRSYKPFEYQGSNDATVVIVSMGGANAAISEAVHDLVKSGLSVGFINVRLYRPWKADKFLDLIPKTCKILVVVDKSSKGDSGDGPLALDIAASFVDRSKAPNLISARFAPGLENVHPAAVRHFLLEYALHKGMPNEIFLHSSIERRANDAVVEAIFWDKKAEGTTGALNRIEKDINPKSTKTLLQKYVRHLATAFEPIQITHVRASKKPHQKHHLVDQAHVVMLHDVSAAQDYNFVGTLRQGGKLFINTPLAKEDLLEALTDQVKLELVKKQVSLYIMDASLIATNYTIFYGEPKDYLSEILSAVFYHLAFSHRDAQNYLRAQLDRITHSKDSRNIIYTKREAIQHALAKLNSIGVLNHASVGDNIEHLPVFVKGTVPSKAGFSLEETNTDTTLRLVQKHQALLPVIFPSAYKLHKKLRPDIEGGFTVKVTENLRLTPCTYDRNVFHMELDTTGTGLKYEIGDALGIYAQNDHHEVVNFFHSYGLDSNQIVFVDRFIDGKTVSEVRTVEQLFVQTLDIFGKPGKKFYQYMAVHATDDTEKETIAKILETNESFDEFVENYTPTFADLLKLFPSAKLTAEQLIKVVPSMKPRHYSIASSQRVHPNSVHLLIVLVDWKDKNGKVRFGQATQYLVNAKIGDSITVSVKPSVMKLPPSLEDPVIMAGLGTGMAPFRAFIEERMYWKKQGKKVGPMALYFGSRNRANEYLYGEELEAYHSEGILTFLRLAFSRDQKQKVYIQHKIQEDSDYLHKLMVKAHGSFYLCGPTWPVPDVTDALLSAFVKSMPMDNAKEFLEQLKNDERFVLEVY